MQIKFDNITTLSKEEQLQVLDWRNSENVRANMLNQKIISKEDHLSYCEKLKKNNSTILYRVTVNGSPCGVVNFTDLDYKNKTGEYGLYVVDQRPGIGLYLGRLAVYYFFEILCFTQLNILVLSHNKNAIMFNEKILLFKNPSITKNEFEIEGKLCDAIHYSMSNTYWDEQVKAQYQRTLNAIEFTIDGKNKVLKETL